MSAARIISTHAEATSVLEAAKKKSEELIALLEMINDNVTSGVYTPTPPRPRLEVIGLMSNGVSQVSQGLGNLQVSPVIPVTSTPPVA